jgi:hypothetical protein
MSYRLLVGLDYNGKRGEAGDIVSDLPEKSITWLVKQDLIESVKSTRKPQEDADANI